MAQSPRQQHPPALHPPPTTYTMTPTPAIVSRDGGSQSPDNNALHSMMVTMLAMMDARDERAAELDRKRKLDHERWMRDHERDRELEDKREKARARERAEDLERHERWMRDHERDRERHRLRIETHRENSAGLQQLRRDSNNPRLSHRGTPTGTPVPAVDDRPKPAPRKTPTKVCHTVPYQAADRHPGSAETTPPPPPCASACRILACPHFRC